MKIIKMNGNYTLSVTTKLLEIARQKICPRGDVIWLPSKRTFSCPRTSFDSHDLPCDTQSEGTLEQVQVLRLLFK